MKETTCSHRLGFLLVLLRFYFIKRTEDVFCLLILQPDRQDELERIEGAGGRVINWNGARVFGVLAMSRAIGFLLSLVLYFVSDFFV